MLLDATRYKSGETSHEPRERLVTVSNKQQGTSVWKRQQTSDFERNGLLITMIEKVSFPI